MKICRGTRFATKYEQMCIALTKPDKNGWFRAMGDEGEIQVYQATWVVRVNPGDPAKTAKMLDRWQIR